MIKAVAVTLSLVLIYGAITLVANSHQSRIFYCSECASERRDSTYMIVGAVSRTVKDTEFTALVKAVDPGPCAHRWVSGEHGSRIKWTQLHSLKDSGVLRSVMAVDPESGVELIRWTLRTSKSLDLNIEPGFRRSLATRAEFRAWFEEFRRRVGTE